MILVDANLLLYAHLDSFPQHKKVRTWLDGRINAPGRVGMPWPSLLAFLRISTNARAFERPLTIQAAWRQVSAWLAAPTVWVPRPTEQHDDVLGKLLDDPSVVGNLVPDAHLAALAIEHGLALCSTDGDFGRFESLSWSNPLRD